MKFSDTFAYKERLEKLDGLLLNDKHFIEDTEEDVIDDKYVETVCSYIGLRIAREELVEFGNEDFSEAAFDQFKKTKDRYLELSEELYYRGDEKPAFIDFRNQLSGNVKADKLYTEFKAKNIEVTKVDNTKYLEDKKKPQPEHVYMKDTSLYTNNLKGLENYENNKKEEVGLCLEQNREIRAANVAAQYYAFRRVKEDLLAIKDDEFDLPGVDLIYNETQLAEKYVKEVKKLTGFKKTVKNSIKQGEFDHESFYEACKSLENKGIKNMTQQEFQDFVAGVRKDFNKLKEFMNELPAAWPEWEEHFSEMDVNIPGREEKADFYISYMNQCDDAYSLELLINDLRPYEDVFKQTLKNIVETMEPHIKAYLEKKEINGNEPDSEHNNANKGRENDDFIHLEDSDYSESEADERDSGKTDELLREEAEQNHEARIKKYNDDKRAKERAKAEVEKTEAEVNEEDAAFDASEWVNVDKPHNGPQYSTRGKFDDVYQKLKQARNFTSSGQYDELLTMVKKMNESDDFKGSEVLDDEQKCVIRLLAIKSRINTYLKHKAVDGVKQNSYKKLAAVEELNELVSDRLSNMEFKTFNFNGENISKNSLNITYKQESEAYYNKESVRAKEDAPEGLEDKDYQQKLEKTADRYPKATLQEMKNVDRCMCRIILGALANDNVPVERINELKEQRITFRENPGEKIVAEVVDKPVRGR